MNTEHQDLLISRIADGDADTGQWDEIFALAEADATLWRRIVEVQRDQADLRRLADRVAAVADRVAAPSDAGGEDLRGMSTNGTLRALTVTPAPRTTPRPRHDRANRINSWSLGSGWAVAALVFIALILNLRQSRLEPIGTVREPGFAASIIPTLSTQDAFDTYMEQGRAEGRILSETPRRVLLETRALPADGGYELIYLQQVMEKTVVPNLYQFRAQDERGQPALVRYEQPIRGKM